MNKTKFYLKIILLLCFTSVFSQTDGMNRMGFVHRYDNWVYPDNVLSEWKKKRGDIDPSIMNGVLSNPYRQDGTSLSYGIDIPSGFTGKIPVFTLGNQWPIIGSNQTAPLTYKDLETDTGVQYQNGQITGNTTITRTGIQRITIVNKTPYSFLISSGVFPGNEQPGQVMTIVNPNQNSQLPIPPKDWWEFVFNGSLISAVPEVYSSVAGLNPLDAPGWKHSSWSPRYTGGAQERDFGTGGFAYTFGSLFGRNDGTYDLSNTLFAGFHTNEGYDPLVSGDPGYGCAFYINGQLQAVMDISLTGKHTAQAILVAQTRHNPAPEPSAFGPGNSHLKSIIGVQPGEKAELHYISHETAQELIQTYSSQGSWKRVEKLYQSNTQASVTDVPLPNIFDGSDGDDSSSSCSDGIQNGNETGIDCGGDCSPCDTGGGDDNDNSITKIEAEFAELNKNAKIYNDDSASNGKGIAYLDERGNGFTLSNVPKASKIEIFYASENTGEISIKVNGVDQGNINFTSNGNWTGDYTTASKNIEIPKGATLKIVNNRGDSSLNIDYINFISESTPNNPTCNDGIKNGDETDIDCGGSCKSCEQEPTCEDGIKNGDETSIDCGGSCKPCEDPISNVIKGKFVPKNQGTLLAIGQDVTSINDYVNATNQIPAALSGYTSINNLEGINTSASYGTGLQHLSAMAEKYPNSGLVVAVYLVDLLNDFNNGEYDQNMDKMIDLLVALDRPIYLRWGYEFDGPHNKYQPEPFKKSWRKMFNRIKEKGADKHIAMVWHSGSFCGSTYNNYPMTDWYPGANYVDLMGISVFTPNDCNYKAQDELVNFARKENKPVIIAEATPQGYNNSDTTKAPVFGDNVGIKQSRTAQQIWDEWYQPFFDYINKNQDAIRLVTYINANWDSQGFWDSPYEMGYWGDSRIQANTTIQNRWNNQVNASSWLKASNSLFDIIGYNTNTGTPPDTTTPSCNDGIRNGNETGIDCGGDCKACTTPEPDPDPDPQNNCEDFGISYVNNNTARVYQKDLGFTSNIYACIDGNCYTPTLEDGYYYFDFNETTTYSYVKIQLGQSYTIKFQADFKTIAEQTVTFSKDSCSWNANKQVDDLASALFTLYPNPANNSIELNGPQISSKTLYAIYSLDGKELQKGIGKQIDISQLPKGIFLIKTDTKSYRLFSKM